ncbi:hypothetical protein CVD28_04285 [Bacillus sp. M6-12]|nr:hypothetical protein CVD28_04285 [Bacillus sp. M6-12]
MWERIFLKKVIEKSYGKLTRFGMTMYECVGKIATNHLKKIHQLNQLKSELTQQQQQITQLTELLSVVEHDTVKSSLVTLQEILNRQEQSLKLFEEINHTEEQNSSDIWKTLHGEKVLLHESIRLLGKILQKKEHESLFEYETKINELSHNIATMINKKEREAEIQ